LFSARFFFGKSTVKIGSGYRTACGSSHLKPHSTTTCNVTVTHNDSAVGLVKMYQT